MDSSPVLADLGGHYLKTSACHRVLTTLSVVRIFSDKKTTKPECLGGLSFFFFSLGVLKELSFNTKIFTT